MLKSLFVEGNTRPEDHPRLPSKSWQISFPVMVENAKPVLMEPITDVELSIPSECLNEIINDIMTRRRGKISDYDDESSKLEGVSKSRKLLHAQIPFSEVMGYATFIRSMTKVKPFCNLREKDPF